MAQPKLLFLGTGGDALVVGQQMRASGGIILDIDDYQFHIDPGPGALVRAKQYGVNIRNNTAVVVTQNHINHCNDVNAVIEAMTHGGLDRKGILIANKTVYEGAEGIDPLLTKYHRNLLERCILVEAGKRVGVGDIEIKALKSKHSDPNAVGLKFITDKFTLCYTSDTAYDEEVLAEYADSDVLVINTLNPFEYSKEGHLNAEDVVKIIEKIKPKFVIITHFGIKMLKEDPLIIAREIQRRTNVSVVAAKDGMAINPVSHSVALTPKD